MSYPPLPVPPPYQGPSGEPGQILLNGIVRRVTLFHGSTDDEADWHVYIRPDRADWPVDVVCELMVLDDFESSLTDDKFFSADVSRAFRLVKSGSINPAWDVGMFAIHNQGNEHDVEMAGVSSRLVTQGGRVYLQGAYVNDEAHGTKVEIHPLDAIAFAIDENDRTIVAKYGQSDWPERFVRWRVAYFANSSHHRINGESYLKKERTSTWLLDLPGSVPKSPHIDAILEIVVLRRALHVKDTAQTHTGRGAASVESHSVVFDPKDGRNKLRVGAKMAIPDKLGGIVVLDYAIRSLLQVDQGSPVIG